MASLPRHIEEALLLRSAIEELDVGVAAWDAATLALRTGNALGRRLASSVDRATLAEARGRLEREETVTLAISARGGSRLRVTLRDGHALFGERLLVASIRELREDVVAVGERLGLKYRERQIIALVLAGLRNREIA
ncbi:MAG: hypothetical protein ACXVDD_21595, partial [Polyangia bacterium]